MAQSVFPSERDVADSLALLTDLYQLTMAATYFREGMTAPATFSFFVRQYPPDRGYLVAGGLEDVLQYLETFHFSAAALQHLQQTGLFSADFLAHLAQLRFTGDVWAQAEGSLCFVPEPLIEVTAPLIEAQLVETYLINQMNLQTLLTTKAARCVCAAQGRDLIDFSLRRTHGTDAAMKVARASFIAGFKGTSNVLAARRYGIPAVGTMAHSYVESFADEIDAFRAFARLFPENSTLLVDTYDTLSGLRKAAVVGQEMAARGQQLRGVRLDSGDLWALSRAARALLDAAGLERARIFASGGLDEFAVADLLARGAPIDAFGIGTQLGVSGDAPWLDCAYKLVEYAGTPRLKLSSQKATLVGRKQVWQASDAAGRRTEDVLASRDENAPSIAAQLGVEPSRLRPRLQEVMRGGRRTTAPPRLVAIRRRFAAEFESLPVSCWALRAPSPFPVRISAGLQQLQQAATAAAQAQVQHERGVS